MARHRSGDDDAAVEPRRRHHYRHGYGEHGDSHSRHHHTSRHSKYRRSRDTRGLGWDEGNLNKGVPRYEDEEMNNEEEAEEELIRSAQIGSRERRPDFIDFHNNVEQSPGDHSVQVPRGDDAIGEEDKLMEDARRAFLQTGRGGRMYDDHIRGFGNHSNTATKGILKHSSKYEQTNSVAMSGRQYPQGTERDLNNTTRAMSGDPTRAVPRGYPGSRDEPISARLGQNAFDDLQLRDVPRSTMREDVPSRMPRVVRGGKYLARDVMFPDDIGYEPELSEGFDMPMPSRYLNSDERLQDQLEMRRRRRTTGHHRRRHHHHGKSGHHHHRSRHSRRRRHRRPHGDNAYGRKYGKYAAMIGDGYGDENELYYPQPIHLPQPTGRPPRVDNSSGRESRRTKRFLGIPRPNDDDEEDEEEDAEDDDKSERVFTKRRVVKAGLLAASALALGLIARKVYKKKKENKKVEDELESSDDEEAEGTLFDENGNPIMPSFKPPPLPKAGLFGVTVPQNQAVIVERGGRYHRKLDSGSNFLTPCVDKVAYVHSLKELAIPVPFQPCFTKDNVAIQASGAIYMKIEDPVAATYGVDNPYRTIVHLVQTCIRNEVAKLTVNEAMEDRVEISDRTLDLVNDAARPWGVRCVRFELRELDLPKELRDALDAEAAAERQKRARIMEAEAEREEAINKAEAELQAQMRRSQAQQLEIVNRAIGEAHAIEERGEAVAQAMRGMAEVIRQPGGEQAMQMRLAEQFIQAYGNATRHPNVRPPLPNDMAENMNNAMDFLNTFGGENSAGNAAGRIPLADMPDVNPFDSTEGGQTEVGQTEFYQYEERLPADQADTPGDVGNTVNEMMEPDDKASKPVADVKAKPPKKKKTGKKGGKSGKAFKTGKSKK